MVSCWLGRLTSGFRNIGSIGTKKKRGIENDEDDEVRKKEDREKESLFFRKGRRKGII